MLDVGEVRVAVERDLGACRELISGWDPELAGRPSTIPGWTLLDLARHLVWGQRLQASAWRIQRTGASESAEGSLPAASDPAAVVRALDAAHADFMAELELVTPERLEAECSMPYGAMPGGLVLQIAAMETGVHRFDLEQSLGRRPDLHDDVLDATAVVLTLTLSALGAMSTQPPATGTTVRLRSSRLDFALTMGDEGWLASDSEPDVEVRGADDAVMLFALGRTALSEPTNLSVEPQAAVETFKQWFPGP